MSNKTYQKPPPITKVLVPAEDVQDAVKECKETVKAILAHYADFINLIDDGQQLWIVHR